MKENIGQVVLDYTYYPGEDLYSDGAIEDEMLEIAGEYASGELNQVIAARKSWPILYHFSHIRENIVSWLPFTGEEHVLEIGSGCGAVTGALCDKAREVTCIELSRKRSQINARRHQEKDNLTILVGNFQDIEKTLTEKYDYITLIGVFEYGEAYISSKNPYVDFLKIIARHLKPDGKIILAIENRFGLKYWAGCTEDHFGAMFEGLEGYPASSGVKTFTKKELGEILQKAGNLKSSWYYPFPDYKFPMTIYSEKRLPAKGELNRLEHNFDRLRMNLFQESAVYDSILENDMYPQFANSFFLIIGQEETESPQAYVKFSNERDLRFAIRTDICQKDGGFFVEKMPAAGEAWAHVQSLQKIEEALKEPYEKEGLKVNACRLEDKKARLEYLQGVTLEEKLDGLLLDGKPDEAETLLFSFVDKIKKLHQGEVFKKTPEFIQVFGDVRLKDGLACGRVSNIDLVPANIFLNGESASVIDYEWTFFFPIPVKFLVYRLIHYYLESDGKRHVLKDRDFYGKAGITQKEQAVFAGMEKSFQDYMLGQHIPMLAMYPDISPGKVDVLSYFQQIRMSQAQRELQVFFDNGRGFCEEDSRRYPMTLRGVNIEIPVPAGTAGLRLDPGEARGGFSVECLCWKNDCQAAFTANGFLLGENRWYFGGGDPQIILEKLPKDGGTLVLTLEMLNEQEAQQEFWSKFARADREKDAGILELKRKLRIREQQITEMENTKVWRLYRKLKK